MLQTHLLDTMLQIHFFIGLDTILQTILGFDTMLQTTELFWIGHNVTYKIIRLDSMLQT